MPRCRDLLCHLARRQMPTFTGLRALTYFDLDQVRRVDGLCGDAKTTRRNLNAAVERILPKQLWDFAPFAVDREHIQTKCGFGIGTVGDLTLRTKGHGCNDERIFV